MGRKSYVVRPVEQLKSLSAHTLNLCDVCKGCTLMEGMKELEKAAWKQHRQGIKTMTYRCNSFTPDQSRRKVAPPIGEGNV